jgi:hypothetical protein
MLLLAWTAAYVVYAVLAISIFLIGLRWAVVQFTTGRTRQIADVVFALLGLAILLLLFR